MLLAALLVGRVAAAQAPDPAEWRNPQLTQQGQELPRTLNQLRYYGWGPWENYADRYTAALLGVYQDLVRREFSGTYIRPQEYGYHTDVCWLTLTDATGQGLRV